MKDKSEIKLPPRWIGIVDYKKVKTELITFSDASKLAYGELHI